jgi:hypothetical protein
MNPDVVSGRGRELLEFQPQDGNRPPRRIVIDEGALGGMDEAQLRAAYVQARPIGGDHYGRPGKRMGDVGRADAGARGSVAGGPSRRL